MTRNKLFIVFVFLVFCGYGSCGFASDLYNEINKKKPKIEKKLLNKIEFIRNDANFNKEKLFLLFLFYEKNDTLFANISYDLGPPYFFSDKNFIGYSMYKNNVLIFMSEISYEIVSNFVEINKLNFNLEDIGKMTPHNWVDGETYVFYINELNEFILSHKYRY